MEQNDVRVRYQNLLVRDPPFAFYDAADSVALLATTFEDGLCLLELLGGNHQHHADAHVEGAHHVVVRNVPDGLQVTEDGENGPGVDFDNGSRSFGKHAREVLGNASPANVSHGADRLGFNHAAHNRPLALVRAHQFAADFAFDLVHVGVGR